MEIREAGQNLFYGGQPSAEDLKDLAAKGIKTVVNLRAPGEETELDFGTERELAEELGMKYVSFPVSLDKVPDDLAEKINEAIRATEGDGAVFVH